MKNVGWDYYLKIIKVDQDDYHLGRQDKEILIWCLNENILGIGHRKNWGTFGKHGNNEGVRSR